MSFRLALEKDFPLASTYRGPAERGTATFRGLPEQVVPVGFVASIASVLVPAIRSNGGEPLRVRIWANTSPTFHTDYRVELSLMEPARAALVGRAVAAAPFPWLFLLGALAILGLVALASWQISRINWGPLGLSTFAVAAIAGLVILGLAGSKRRTA